AQAPAPEQAPEARPAERPRAEREEPGALEQIMSNPAVKSFMRSAASSLGREITRGLFGTRRR
ncbi:MAG: double-strand break repair helicase HerA and related ATPase, partial [Pseudonocardiales bacterium]|nr:double-strand break repair helicase HerA and related ATPase [Pseudonocardiales bacterium]